MGACDTQARPSHWDVVWYRGLQQRSVCALDSMPMLVIYLVCRARVRPPRLTITVGGSPVSQPGDTVLSVMNKQAGINVVGAIKQLGPTGLFLGASARCVHVTSYIVAQFLIYDSIKRLCGIPVAGEQPQATKK